MTSYYRGVVYDVVVSAFALVLQCLVGFSELQYLVSIDKRISLTPEIDVPVEKLQ